MLWQLIAWLCSRRHIRDWIIRRAMKTPYTHITSADGSDVYMYRWWLFNPYPDRHGGRKAWRWLPSIRVHHICRADADRHLHDHPWHARSIILDGSYEEIRKPIDFPDGRGDWFRRERGQTASLKFNEFHQVIRVSEGGVITLFFTWKYRGTWGFWVDGKKVPWREYLGIPKP